MKRVSIQGILGSFHDEAAETFFHTDDLYIEECKSFQEVIDSVTGSDADFGVIAIDNSITGSIIKNFRLLRDNKLFVCGEVVLPFTLHLMALPYQKKSEIKEIWSHPIALDVAEKYLDQHPNWKITKKFDTAYAAREISMNNIRNVGVLASQRAAKLYKLEILEENIQGDRINYLRFFVFSSNTIEVKDADKASLIITLGNEPGSLLYCLDLLAKHDMSITKILSHPSSKRKGEHTIYCDVQFQDKKKLDTLFQEFDSNMMKYKVLGVYKAFDFK